MKMTYFKKLTATLFVSVCAITPTLAAITGTNSLGNAANAVDAWVAVCPPLYNTLEVRVNNADPTLDNVFVVLGTSGKPTTQIRDTNPNGYSAWVSVAGGAGPYVVAFKKSTAGVIGYNGQVQCRGSLGVFNPVEFGIYINQ
jgi:hypothetical protein